MKHIKNLSLTSNNVYSNHRDLFDANVRDFLDEKHPDITTDELRSKIEKIEIKNLIKETVGLQKFQTLI